MRNLIRRTIILFGLAFLCIMYPFVIQPEFKLLQAYWIIKAILELTFWVVAFYPKYSWSKWNYAKRALAIGVAVLFCFYFMPVSIISLPIAQRFYNLISTIIAFAVFLDNDDDDNHGGKKKREKVDKEKLKWVPEGT